MNQCKFSVLFARLPHNSDTKFIWLVYLFFLLFQQRYLCWVNRLKQTSQRMEIKVTPWLDDNLMRTFCTETPLKQFNCIAYFR